MSHRLRNVCTTAHATVDYSYGTLLHELLDEITVKVTADRVVDEALLLLGLVLCLVAEHHIVVPAALNL